MPDTFSKFSMPYKSIGLKLLSLPVTALTFPNLTHEFCVDRVVEDLDFDPGVGPYERV